MSLMHSFTLSGLVSGGVIVVSSVPDDRMLAELEEALNCF